MTSPARSRLQIVPRGLLTHHCEVLSEGRPLARTLDIWFPLRTGFTVDGREWVVRTHTPGGRGIDLLREIAMGAVMGRGCYGLFRDDGALVASARERGFFKGGFDLQIDGSAALLESDRGRQRFDYTGPEGSGCCEFVKGEAGLRVDLPSAMPLPLQLFIGLLAMRHTLRMAQTGGD